MYNINICTCTQIETCFSLVRSIAVKDTLQIKFISVSIQYRVLESANSGSKERLEYVFLFTYIVYSLIKGKIIQKLRKYKWKIILIKSHWPWNVDSYVCR